MREAGASRGGDGGGGGDKGGGGEGGGKVVEGGFEGLDEKGGREFNGEFALFGCLVERLLEK